MPSATPTPRPFRFGVQVSSAPSGAQWRELGRRAEALGYATATIPDHFTDQFAPLLALQSLADATTTLRVGALVLDNDYRHPLVLAKELATIDLLSEGRLEIGLGAGWMATDYAASGIPYDPPGVRVSRFAEALEVLRGCLGPGPFSFTGDHYRIENYTGAPTPVQQPCPPILIGGGGPRVLRIAAQHADIVGINATLTDGVVGPGAFDSMTAAAVDHKVALLRAAAVDRIDRIEMNIRVFMTAVTDSPAATIEQIAHALAVPTELVRDSPFALIGSPTQIIETLQARRERWGFSYIIVGAEDLESFAPVVAALAGT